MSYWSLRRAEERAAAGHELARGADDSRQAPASRPATHDAFGVELRRPTVELHPATVTSPARGLRQRATELEHALWSIPSPDPADVHVIAADGVRIKARASW